MTDSGAGSRAKKPPRGRLPKGWSLLLLLAVSLAVVWFATRLPFFQTLELKTLDYRFRLNPVTGPAGDEIVLVEIDDFTISNLEPVLGRWPWPRDAHSVLLKFMRRAGARVVGYDVQFSEFDLASRTDGYDPDLQFAEDTSASGNVVHAVYLGHQEDTGDPAAELVSRHSVPARGGFPSYVQADFPYPALAEAAHALGHITVALDPDGPWRRYQLLARYRDRLIPALGFAMALSYENLTAADIQVGHREVTAGRLKVPLDADWRLPIWFNGGPGTYPGYNFSQIFYSQLQMEEGETPVLDPALFRDKIVLVGVTASALHDVFTTPYSGDAGESQNSEEGTKLGKMAGIEVHANVIDDLLHGRYLHPVDAWFAWGLTGALAAAVLILVFYGRLWVAAGLSIGLVGGYLWLVQILFSHYWQLPVMPVLLGSSLSLVLGFAYQYWFEGSEKRKVKQIFSRFVSRDVYQQLLQDPQAAELGGKRMMVTVLFSDLRGFTAMSENRPPEAIVTQLNEYFSAMVDLVFEHRGTIDKFVGDMIMALFNAPLADDDHADHALQCAVAMQTRLRRLNVDWQRNGHPPLACGIGINSGEMIAGNVGAETIRSYTVIGDNVNLGARLESLCKEYQAEIIISEFTQQLLRHEYPLTELGEVLVKGKSKPVRIFKVEWGGE